MKKKTTILLLSMILVLAFASCSGDTGGSAATPKAIESNEKANEASISAAVSAMGDHTLAINEYADWGISYDEVKGIVDEPYINDTPQYLTTAFYAKLPSSENWTDKDGNINADDFIQTDILSYFAMEEPYGLYEYGYLAPNANLHQYDFLKAYYTDKYGEPDDETWEWNDPEYQPTGEEDYYQMFVDGLVKVVTVWDIEELDAVLVIDWLNDPKQYNNNYGQISFYDRSDDFSIEAVTE